MATIDKKGNLKGIVGNLYFRTVSGKQVVQTRPYKRAQTTQSKAAATEFALVSSTSKFLRHPIQHLLNNHHDSAMFTRLNATLYKVLKANRELPRGIRNFDNSPLTPLLGFNFTQTSLFDEYFFGELALTELSENTLSVTLQHKNINQMIEAPQGTTFAKLLLYGIAYDFGNRIYGTVTTREFTFSLTSTASVDERTSFTLPSKGFTFILLGEVQYFLKKREDHSILYNTKQFNPSCILYFYNKRH